MRYQYSLFQFRPSMDTDERVNLAVVVTNGKDSFAMGRNWAPPKGRELSRAGRELVEHSFLVLKQAIERALHGSEQDLLLDRLRAVSPWSFSFSEIEECDHDGRMEELAMTLFLSKVEDLSSEAYVAPASAEPVFGNACMAYIPAALARLRGSEMRH
jgi:hypothetical protein